jgi:hypothetical protein
MRRRAWQMNTRATSKRREIFVYDGRTCIGRFVVDDKTGDAKAFNASAKTLGKYHSFKAAARAISEADLAAKGSVDSASREASRGAPVQ